MLLFGVRLVIWDSTWLTKCRHCLSLKLIFRRRENKMPQVAMGLSVSWPLFGAISSSSVPQSPHRPAAWLWDAHCYCIAIQTALHLRRQFTVKANILPTWCLFLLSLYLSACWPLDAGSKKNKFHQVPQAFSSRAPLCSGHLHSVVLQRTL